jgi:hypothetical protein
LRDLQSNPLRNRGPQQRQGSLEVTTLMADGSRRDTVPTTAVLPTAGVLSEPGRARPLVFLVSRPIFGGRL